MERYIFLDFDGVITTEKSGFSLDPDKCQIIQDIIDKTNAYIIVTSSWRKYHTVDSFKEKLYLQDNHYIHFTPTWTNRIIGLTIDSGIIIQASQMGLHIPRGSEIDHYLDNKEPFKSKICGIDYQYVIIDDDADILYYQHPHFIQTNSLDGISSNDAIRAINILNSKTE